MASPLSLIFLFEITIFGRCSGTATGTAALRLTNVRCPAARCQNPALFHKEAGDPAAEVVSANTKGRLLSRPLHRTGNENYFLGAMASLAALATRNFTTVLALIWIGSPV